MRAYEHIHDLLTLARRDWRAAYILAQAPDPDSEIIGFHLQQAAEKALNAWLALGGETYSGTHALSLLIHRVCYVGSGHARQFPSLSEWESRFRRAMSMTLQAAGLSTEVFIWKDFHDRYVISDLVGITVPNGFDTTSDHKSITTWTRLGRKDRDDVQREFDPARSRRGVEQRFVLP